MRIAVIGGGNIGGTLGAKWAAAGHAVTFGARDPNSPKLRAAMSSAGETARVESIGAAIEAAEVVLLALPAAAVNELMAAHGPALNGKFVIDATNRFGQPVVNHLASIQQAAPQAILIRAFNSLGWENFADPLIDGQQADLFYASPDGEAREVIETLINDIGLRPIRAGDLSQAAVVDAIGSLWVALAFGQQRGRRMAFKLITPQ